MPNADRPHDRPGNPPAQAKRWLGIYFQCCGVYARIYQNRDATAYEGRCPRCGAQISALIGPDGTNRRFFEAI